MLPSIEYQVSGTNTPLSYTWDGDTNALVILVQTDGSGNAVSTATQIKALIDAVPYMHDRFRITLVAGNSGAGIVTVMPHTHFQYV